MSALILDCDGVLADTERYGHLPAFNATFEQFGLPARWSEDEYADRLKIGGGKERMASLFTDAEFVRAADIPADADARAELLARWHRAKKGAFTALVAEGKVPPRPGIRRVITATLDASWTVAVASTSSLASVRAVLAHALGAQLAERVPYAEHDLSGLDEGGSRSGDSTGGPATLVTCPVHRPHSSQADRRAGAPAQAWERMDLVAKRIGMCILTTLPHAG